MVGARGEMDTVVASRLTQVRDADPDRFRRADGSVATLKYVWVSCTCGSPEKRIRLTNFRRTTVSCGCLRADANRSRNRKRKE